MENDVFVSGDLTGLFVVGGIFIFVAIVLMIILYVVQALALMKMAVNHNLPQYKVFAWIPLLNSYLMAYLAEDEDSDRKQFAGIYLGVILGSALLSLFIPFISIASTIFYYVVVYKILKKWYGSEGSNTVIWLILSILTGGLSFMIQLFIKRNELFYSFDEDLQYNKLQNKE